MVSNHIDRYFSICQGRAIVITRLSSFSGEMFLIFIEYQYAPCITTSIKTCSDCMADYIGYIYINSRNTGKIRQLLRITCSPFLQSRSHTANAPTLHEI